MLVDISDCDTFETEDDFEIFLRENSDKAFLNVLISFIKEHKNEPSLDDIKGFINVNKENLSKIKDGIKNLLIGFTKICVLNNFQDIEVFLKLARAFQIEDVTCLRQGIIERVEGETRGNNKDSRKITDFFQTPKDLFSFYAKAHPRLFDDGNGFANIICIANEHRIAKTTNQNVYNEHFNLFDLLQRYDNKQIAAFIKSEPVSKDVIYLSTNVLIWVSFFDSEIKPNKVKEIFPTIRNLIDFYIYKVTDQLKQEKNFSIFCFLTWWAYTDQGAATGEWGDYLKEISKDGNHISLFFNFFEGKMGFEEQDISNIVANYGVFSGFRSIQGFLDFYLEIYSTHSDCLKSKNSERDYILNSIICKYVSDITNFLSTDGNEQKYSFFIPYLINEVCDYQYCKMSNFSNIVKFLDKNVNLDQDLKNKLLKKIDDDIVEKMNAVAVYYADKTYEYPLGFETNLSYV